MRREGRQSTFWSLGALLALAHAPAQAQLNFNDITYWTGTGSNQAALVIDWKSGTAPQSLVWGYRWNGTATGAEMFNAIRQSDPRLYSEWVPGYVNQAVFGLGLDRNENGFAKTDPQDSYREGWFTNGFWAYYVDVTPGNTLPAWTFASSGMDGRTLVNGSWDALSWAQNYNATDPAVPAPISAPVPEPHILAFALSSGVGLLLLRRVPRQANSASRAGTRVLSCVPAPKRRQTGQRFLSALCPTEVLCLDFRVEVGGGC